MMDYLKKYIISNSFSVWLCFLSYGLNLSSAALSHEDIEVHLEKGRVLLSEGKYNDALTHYQAAVEADKNNYLTYYKRATVLLALGRHKSALDDLNEVISLKPDFIAARSQRGALLFKQGRLDEAHVDLEWVLRSDPYDAEANHLYTLIEPIKRNVQNAYMFFEDQEWIHAVDILTQLLNDLPWDVKLREMRAEAYEKSGDLMGAISDLRATSKMRPDNTYAILKLSKLHFDLGEPEESLMSIRDCLKLDPDHKECFTHYKKVKKIAAQVSSMHEFSKNSQFENCVDKANSALKLKDSISPAIKHLILATKCHCLNKNGDSSEAIETCSAALETNEHDVNVLCDRAEAHINNEDYDEAVADFQKAHQIDPHLQRAEDGIKKARKLEQQSKKRDYYKILGVKRNASKKEINKAYRKLAQKWHPDNFQSESDKKSAEKKFMDIASAKEVLSDDEKRQKFDMGEDPLDPESQAGQGFNPFGHGFHPHGFSQGGYTFKFSF